MRWVTILTPLLMGLALLCGWLSPGLPQEAVGARRGSGGQVEPTLRPGEGDAAAIRFLRTLRSDPAPEQDRPPPEPPRRVAEPPPPPDVSVLFKQAFRGVERDLADGELRALVAMEAGGGQTVRMARGEGFIDGWRIDAVNEYAVTLRKGGEVRVVRMFEGP